MTANAASLQLTDAEISSDIKQYNLNTVAGCVHLLCDLIEDLREGTELSGPELEFVAHARELADGVRS